ncbi:hypothetical protein [Paenarthrobacter ureafaciens]|uniref:hypothetical protein n=1 Tax=Paenarthrobacter ureafaciens TaxID=37931 RepID=UPI002DB6034D|nr:hypothetical protein [Paenarthrobacter ureafaciens]MEC3853299.1 hypothetical protein [Paenarthrobacter ureafaciens]
MTRAPVHVVRIAIAATLLAGCTPGVGIQDSSPSVVAAPATSVAGTSPEASATPVPTTSPPQPPAPEAPAPAPEPFVLNLYEEGDFVPQYTFDWCVAASIQMAYNLTRPNSSGTWAGREQQNELWDMARARSSNAFNGANPLGWAQVLNEVGVGPYEVVSIADYNEALRTAASALAETGRPVGLVMWSGRHAWVMSGFQSVGNPRIFPRFEVTGVNVLDPLYPYGSGQWGPSPAPNTLLGPDELAKQFVVREPRRWSSTLPTGYMLVLPVATGDGVR